MNDRVKQFLNLDGDQQAGRWFTAVLALGAIAVAYSVITDWGHNTISGRVKGVVALLVLVGLAGAYLRRPGRSRKRHGVEPTA